MPVMSRIHEWRRALLVGLICVSAALQQHFQCIHGTPSCSEVNGGVSIIILKPRICTDPEERLARLREAL